MIAREFLAELNRLYLPMDDTQRVRDSIERDVASVLAILCDLTRTAHNAPCNRYGDGDARDDAMADLQCALADVQRALPGLMRAFGGAA